MTVEVAKLSVASPVTTSDGVYVSKLLTSALVNRKGLLVSRIGVGVVLLPKPEHGARRPIRFIP